jgi:hypothetical protein
MPNTRKQRRESLYHRTVLRGHPMAYPCSQCSKLRRSCIVSAESSSCAECLRRGSRCNFDRSSELERTSAQQTRLFEAALAAEASADAAYSRARAAELEASEATARSRRLRRQIDFLQGRMKTLTEEEIQSLEATSFLDSSDPKPGPADSSPFESAPDFQASSPTFSELLNESLLDRGESPLQRP